MAEPTAVIVPVLHRPQHAEPFMASLRATASDAVVYPVCDADDLETIEAWKAAGAKTGIKLTIKHEDPRKDWPGTFAEKVNAAYRLTTEPWLFLVGSDVRFHVGWLDHAQHAAHQSGAKVVGTNDLGNPMVLEGEHATHLLIDRSYVDTQGASWDGPGVVCHEGYRHWFVDDEIVAVAKRRGFWAMAPASIVEHLHPRWGKAEMDDVYWIGEKHGPQDSNLFFQRLARYGSGVSHG